MTEFQPYHIARIASMWYDRDIARALFTALTLISAPTGFGKTTLVKVVRSGAD